MSAIIELPFSRFFQSASRFFFALTIFLIPFRWRMEVWPRATVPVYADYTNFQIFAADIALLYMLVFWAASLIMTPRKLKAGSVFIWLFLVGLTVSGWVSVLGSEDPILSRYHAARFVFLLFFYLFIVNEIENPAWLLVPVGFQILFQSVIAIAQSQAQFSLGLTALGELALDPQRSGVSVILSNGQRFLRSYGLSDHPNILGGCLAFGLILMLAVTLYGRRRQSLLASLVFLIAFPAMLMTFSRSAWISFFAAGSFLVMVETLAQRWDVVRRAAILGVLSLLVAMPFIQKNISLFQSRAASGNVSTDEPMKERAYLLNAGNLIFVEHSAIGIGLGASALAMKRHFPEFPVNYQPPHYALLTAAMETGLPGGAFYLLLGLTPFLMFALKWKTYSSQPIMVGLFALLLAMTVVGFFDYYTWLYAAGRMWQWLGWGLWSFAISTREPA